ncbi:MAG: hypothetical protein U0793_16510 [Gemmataceae bacterium]
MLQHMLLALATTGLFNPSDKVAPSRSEKAALKDEVGDLSGFYTCKGQEVGGKAYSGVAVISKKKDIYVIQWMVTGGATFTGVAIRQGDTFSASWMLPGERGTIRGVNVYKIESGPRLTGRWATLPGPGYLQNETLTFLKALEEEE